MPADGARPPLAVGVVGTGALGRHHVRILAEMPEAELRAIHDARRDVAEELAAAHGTEVAASPEELFEGVEAVVLAVPTVEHAALGVAALEAGLHVLVEKPMASTLAEADSLLEAAGDRVLAVGHVEFYNPAVQALLATGIRPRFVEVQRLSSFSPRSLDIDVILDLMIHDLQIVHALDPSAVEEIRAVGIDVLSERIDLTDARLELASGCVVRLTASRVSETRVRQLRVFGVDSYYSLDYQEQSLKGVRLERRPAGGAHRPEAGSPDIVPLFPRVEAAEPLRRELECFVARCRSDDAPLVDGEQGRRALQTALAVAEQAGRRRGRRRGDRE